MTDELVRTNLGKWGHTTQTYEEHAHAVWVFRKPLLGLAWPLLQRLFGSEVQDAWTDYVRLARFETRGHDYDKLFVPQSLLRGLTTFHWHADTTDPANQRALEAFLDQAQLPCSRPVAEALLQACGSGHEGLRTPEKVELMRTALRRYFCERGLRVSEENSDWLSLAKLHACTLRAADAVASAGDGQAFKDDVSILVNWIQQLLHGAQLTVISLCFDTALSQSSSAAVLAGYYGLYDTCYKALGGLLERNGIVVADNSRTIAALALTDNPNGLEGKWWEYVAVALGGPEKPATVKKIVQWNQVEVDPRQHAVDFDTRLKDVLWRALSQAYRFGETPPTGLPCAACGRHVITSAMEEKLPSNLGNEIPTLESRGDFGFVKGVKESLYGLTRALGRSDLLVCVDCICLSQFQEEIDTRAALVFGSSSRTYVPHGDALVRLTSAECDPLVTLLYGFELQQQALESLVQTIQTARGQGRLIAGSALLFGFTPTPAALLASLDMISQAIARGRETALVDGKVTYNLDFGIRIGAGAILPGCQVHDTIFIRGVHPLREYLDRLKAASILDRNVSPLGDKDRRKAILRLSQRRGVITLAKELMDSDVDLTRAPNQRNNPRLGLDQVLEIARHVESSPQSLSDLRQFYSSA